MRSGRKGRGRAACWCAARAVVVVAVVGRETVGPLPPPQPAASAATATGRARRHIAAQASHGAPAGSGRLMSGYSIVNPDDADDAYDGSDVPGEFRRLTDALGGEQLSATLIRIPA